MGAFYVWRSLEFNKYNKHHSKNVSTKHKPELVSLMGCCVLGMKDDAELKAASLSEATNRTDSKSVNRVCLITPVGDWGR